MDEYVFGAIRAGADAFLLKDTEPDELLRCMRLVAQGDAVMSPAVTRTLIDDYLHRPTSHPTRKPPSLTNRERDVLDGICRGLSNRQIAADLYVGTATVKSYVSRLLDRFGTTSRVGLVVGAYECGLIQEPHAEGPAAPVELAASAERMLACVLFVDIVDSTKQLSSLGDRRWVVELEKFDAAVRRHVARCGGTLIKKLGDGAVVVFSATAAAIGCATALCDEVERTGMRLRAGIHTGEIERRMDDIAGIAVQIAARLASASEPGEVLVSRTVVDLASGSGIRFERRGERELKGLKDPVAVFAVDRR